MSFAAVSTKVPSLGGHYPLRRYYGPLRHPGRPGSCPREPPVEDHGHPHRRDFPCSCRFPCMHAIASTPAEPSDPRHSPAWIPALRSDGGGLPHDVVGSASASKFSRPQWRSLLLWPACLPSCLTALCVESSSRLVARATVSTATGCNDYLPDGTLTRWNPTRFSRRTTSLIIYRGRTGKIYILAKCGFFRRGKFKAEEDGFPQNAQIAPKTVPDPNAVRLASKSAPLRALRRH